MRLLLLEDDQELGTWISQSLNKAGHVLDWFQDGRHTLSALITEQSYDVAILDRATTKYRYSAPSTAGSATHLPRLNPPPIFSQYASLRTTYT